MANNPKLVEVGEKTQFSSTNQPKNRRKPSKLKQAIKENDIGIEDVRKAFKYIMDMSETEMDKVINNKNNPFILRCLVKAYKADYKKGNLINITTMLNRMFGQPKEVIEHSIDANITNMTKEDRLKRIEELQAIARMRENEDA